MPVVAHVLFLVFAGRGIKPCAAADYLRPPRRDWVQLPRAAGLDMRS